MSTPSRPPATSGLTSAALRGAVDLGALAQARQAQQQSALGGSAADGGGFAFDVTAADFQMSVLEQSMSVPVVLDLWASWCAPCKQLTPVLTKLAAEYGGRFVLAKVDVDAEQEIAAAFQVQSIPSVFAVVQGQPIPLFQGALPEAQVRAYLEELLRVAGEAGVNGVATPLTPGPPTGDAQEGLSANDARLDLAADAVEAGDWDTAEEHYRAILADNPADPDGRAGVALVSVQRRLEGVDPSAAQFASDANPADVDAALVAADVDIAHGDAPAAYGRLIAAVRASMAENRERARTRLLELFDMAMPDDPDVAAARRALAAALY